MLSSEMTGPTVSTRPTACEEARTELVVDGIHDDDPARRRAPLAGVRERGGDRPLDCPIEVGVVAHDERVLAAELHDRLREPPPRGLRDRAPCRSRARERDQVDRGILDERHPGLGAEALHHVQDARRQPGVEAEAPEPPGRHRRVLGRLEHRPVSAEDRGKRLPGHVRERRVERDQQCSDADRPAKRQDGAMRHRGGRRPPVGAAPLTGDEEAHLDRGVGLAECKLERLARLGGDDLACLLPP